MIKPISEKSKPSKIEIDLTGPDGNAYVLMGYAKQWYKQLDRDSKPLIEEMMSGDYEHLVKVMDREFGDFVIFYK